MRLFKHAGRLKIITQTPSETKRDVREAIRDRFRYTFSDDLAVGESVIQFSGRIWGSLLSRSPLGLIDDGEIRIEESRNCVLVDYSISYNQVVIMWAVVTVAVIPLLFLAFSDFEPIVILLGPFMLFGMLVLIIAIGILGFESLLDGCLERVNGKVIRVSD